MVDDMGLWQSCPLDSIYPVLLVDGIRIKVRDGTVANRVVYAVMGINMEGDREILGLWVGPTGGGSSKFWVSVFNELKNRGIRDVLVLSCDGLKGLPESARAVWELVEVQLSLVSMGVAWRGSTRHPCRWERASATRPFEVQTQTCSSHRRRARNCDQELRLERLGE